jgi:hypothetical protein
MLLVILPSLNTICLFLKWWKKENSSFKANSKKGGRKSVMIKTVFVGLTSFFLISFLLVSIGYLFQIEWLMFRYYEETSTGFSTGGSVIPFIIAIIVTFFIGESYQKRQNS